MLFVAVLMIETVVPQIFVTKTRTRVRRHSDSTRTIETSDGCDDSRRCRRRVDDRHIVGTLIGDVCEYTLRLGDVAR